MQKRKHNIILIGFMGSGKTSVGECLAKRMSYHFLDTDRLLEERAGDTIHHIFSMHGEEYFRDMETELLKEFRNDTDRTILSTGGGLPLREQNAELLRKLGFIVFLKTSKQTTLARLQNDRTRPLLAGEDAEQKVERMLQIRTPIYENAAHLIIETDDKSIDELVRSIMEAYIRQTGETK